MRLVGFTRFLVAEPPVSINMPAIYMAGLMLPGSKTICPEILQRSAQESFAKSRDLDKTPGIEVELFGEVEICAKTGTRDDYFDLLHPKQVIHDTLAAEAAETVKKRWPGLF